LAGRFLLLFVELLLFSNFASKSAPSKQVAGGLVPVPEKTLNSIVLSKWLLRIELLVLHLSFPLGEPLRLNDKNLVRENTFFGIFLKLGHFFMDEFGLFTKSFFDVVSVILDG
jgi:hypothetical protein